MGFLGWMWPMEFGRGLIGCCLRLIPIFISCSTRAVLCRLARGMEKRWWVGWEKAPYYFLRKIMYNIGSIAMVRHSIGTLFFLHVAIIRNVGRTAFLAIMDPARPTVHP